MITLKQFTGQTITPTDDAALYDFFSSKQSGIIDGCQVTSLGDNRLQVSAGRGIIRGRSFVVEQEEIRAQLGTAENQKGRLSIKIDLGNTGTPISFVTAAGETLDNPIQQDINHVGFRAAAGGIHRRGNADYQPQKCGNPAGNGITGVDGDGGV